MIHKFNFKFNLNEFNGSGAGARNPTNSCAWSIAAQVWQPQHIIPADAARSTQWMTVTQWMLHRLNWLVLQEVKHKFIDKRINWSRCDNNHSGRRGQDTKCAHTCWQRNKLKLNLKLINLHLNVNLCWALETIINLKLNLN